MSFFLLTSNVFQNDSRLSGYIPSTIDFRVSVFLSVGCVYVCVGCVLVDLHISFRLRSCSIEILDPPWGLIFQMCLFLFTSNVVPND